ncbi:MAG: recombinase family protein, partial [Armatimonadetes bacterium]|nr:recombinase family protein [Armatimonadota bacterium]
MRYILYARKSSESEDRQVQSIDDQLRILRELGIRQGMQIVKESIESKSAKAPGQRVEFEKMLRLIEQGKADGILCWSVNRLSRNPVDSGKLSWMLQTGALKCIQTPERVYLPEDNVLLFAVETGVANQFILDLKKAVHRGMQSKAEKGWFPHRAPEGYDNDLRERIIIIDPVRFPLLQRAWRLLIEERKSIGEILNILNNDWGYSTRASKRSPSGKMHTSMAYRIFSNPFYAGYFEHGGQTHRGLHPPMVTLEEFRQVQLNLRGQIGKRHKGKHNFPYVGLIVCSRCKRKLTACLQHGHLKRG